MNRVPTTASVFLNIPNDILLEQARFFGDKVVLGFESETSHLRAREWVRIYNQASSVKLTVVDELPNALFVVQFQSKDLRATKLLLLASSPLGARDFHASVNDFMIAFDPCNQADFCHLVTVNIPLGNI